jgi:hypothetical protein
MSAALFGLFVALTLGDRAAAQTPATGSPGKQYTSRLQFPLAFDMDQGQKQRLTDVRLYMKTGAEPWTLKDHATPQAPTFTIKVPKDGEYWFGLQTVDRAGNLSPADPSTLQPALILVVDTQSPEIDVHVPAMSGLPHAGRFFRCTVRDANPDLRSTRFEYQALNKEWLPVEPFAKTSDLFHLPAAKEKNWTGMLRATARDLAGNVAVREMDGKAMGLASATPSKTEQPSGQPVSAIQTVSAVQPVVYREAKPTMVNPPAPAPAERQVLHSTHATLEYQVDQVGPSGIAKVTVWMTRDGGQTWQFLCEDPDKKSPVELDLPGDGIYGVSVAVTNNMGQGCGPPARGTAPDCWIEVALPKTAAAPPPPPMPLEESAVRNIVHRPAGDSFAPPGAALAHETHKPESPATSPAQRQYINSRHVVMDYRIDQVGPSGVAKVEVWMTRDEGKSWQKLYEDKHCKSPAEFELPGEGIYGLVMVVTSGTGLGGATPTPGSPADCWIEVDTTKPTAHLVAVRSSQTEEGCFLQIQWTAEDKNLGAEPVHLSYATQAKGPWFPIAQNLRNDGSYRWTLPANAAGEFYVRLDVCDRAGNVTQCTLPQAVVVDTSRPKAKVLSIHTSTQVTSLGN